MIIVYAAPDGEHITKVWRFDTNAAQDYRLENVKSDIIEFFHLLKREGWEFPCHTTIPWLETSC